MTSVMNHKPRLKKLLMILIITLLCILIYSLDHQRKTRSSHMGNTQMTKHLRDNASDRDAKSTKRPRDPRLNSLFAEDYYHFKASLFEEYFKKNQYSTDSLIPVYLLTKDPAILDQLKQRTNDPQAMITVSLYSEDLPLRTQCIQNYIRLKPDEMTGHMLYIDLLDRAIYLKKKDKLGTGEEESMIREEIQKAFSATTYTGGLEGGANKERDALHFIGKSDIETESYLATNSTNSYKTSGIFSKSIVTAFRLDPINDPKSPSWDPQIASKNLETFLSQSDALSEMADNTDGHGAIDAGSAKKRLLATFPPDLYLESYGKTVKELADETKQTIQGVMDIKLRAYESLRNAEPQVVDQFMKISTSETWFKAEKWLAAQPK